MKYLIINGSPRKKNTWKIVKQAQTNLNGEYEEIHLYQENIPPCTGCMKCMEEGEEKCPHHSQIKPIIEKIKNTDGLIISTPVFAMNVTSLLKNLIDHTAYIYHRPEFFDKKALIIVSTAGAGHKKVAKYIDETLRHWGFNKNHKITIAIGGKDIIDNEKINKIANQYKKDLESEKLHNPSFKDIIFYNVWRAMAVSQTPLPADKEYWYKTGLVEHEFSPLIKLNIIKKIFAKIMFFIMKKAIK